jgi:hypothetical protein
MSERRFNEAEVAAIFERAAESQHTARSQLSSGEGMTLAELQVIGREVGIAPEVVLHAAKAIELGGRPTARRFLGFPVGVGRTIDLGRKLTDEEWERFVVDLRETFDARGTIRNEGSLRQWTNGNLQALLEPTATGHRIRLRTIKGDARSMMVGGLMFVGVAASALVAGSVMGSVADVATWSALGLMAGGGVTMFGIGALRLPSWARLRARQMEQIAARVTGVESAPE